MRLVVHIVYKVSIQAYNNISTIISTKTLNKTKNSQLNWLILMDGAINEES